jgi:hypothetical protein
MLPRKERPNSTPAKLMCSEQHQEGRAVLSEAGLGVLLSRRNVQTD